MKKKISYPSYLITLIIIFLFIWGQTKDEALLPSTKEAVELIPKTDIPPEKNVFFAMFGFNTLDPTKIAEVGQKAFNKAVLEAKKSSLEFMLPLDMPKSNAENLELYQLPCDTELTNKTCLDEVYAQQEIILSYLSQQKDYIDNYLTIQKSTQFAHLFPRNMNASLPLLYISSVSQLLTAKAILDIKTGQIEKGMQFILADIIFYRHMLSNEQRTLEETNTFTNALLQHYFVIDRLIQAGVNLKPYLPKLIPLLAPLSKQEKSLVWALSNERNTQLITQTSLAYQNFYTGNSEIAGCQKNSCSLSRYFLRLIYKFNSTLNATYNDWQPTIDFAKQDYPLDDNYLSLLKSLQQIEINHHSTSTYRLYERYGLFLFKNYEGEKQKNIIYYQDGYTLWFIKLYMLNNTIKQLNSTIQEGYNF